ncbi:carotenoid biosynthesis protein [Rhodococcus sp. ARC_M6]|uniref:carotenoid biosynthesis protein n=1 Tax=Rhodococcus sp. ARC_M6 TaxID=2928852 RepID=UPI001FB2EC61|nr:carotenoid biosynthesis protein [Rhodococcus sp. ARC_M6]MCJ0903771.1 carotenoid biosynthesis protein [Rhodococcus sp. ARC_M6]
MTPQKVPLILALAAVGAQIVYPLVDGSTRDLVTIAVVGLLAAASISHAVINRGAAWTIALIAVTAGIGLASEIVGTATGIPYGCYSYSVDRLGPALSGVPLIIPFAWTAGFYPIWCVATRLVRNFSTVSRRIGRITLTVLGLLGWDLYLDPQMVADRQWAWCAENAGLPGISHIPLTNYAGWIVVGVVMATIMELISTRYEKDSRSEAVPIGLFLWTWLGSALAHSVFLSAPELRYSAMYGFAVMGILGSWLLLTFIRDRTSLADTPPRR